MGQFYGLCDHFWDNLYFDLHNYAMFDLKNMDMPFNERYVRLKEIVKSVSNSFMVETRKLESKNMIHENLSEY